MKKENPTLTVDGFIELVRGYNANQLNGVEFEQYALNMLLSTSEDVKEDKKKQLVEMGK